MYKVIGVCAVGWAAVCLGVMRQDPVTGAWLWIASLALAPVVLLMAPKPRHQLAALRAVEVEAEVWCAGQTRRHGGTPSVAQARSPKNEMDAVLIE